MNPTDQAWLENRISAAVADDFYLDRDEEKRIKEEGSSRGIQVSEIELALRIGLDKIGAVCERILLDELDRLLHQFTDQDRYLDAKEERDALDKVLIAAKGKKMGLDPRVAKEYVDSFCSVNGVKRSADGLLSRKNLILTAVAVAALGVSGFFWWRASTQNTPGGEGKVVDSSAYTLSTQDREELDQLIRKAGICVDEGHYTEPPERSAKALLDRIRAVDPKGQYKGFEIKALVQRILDQYFTLATRSSKAGDRDATQKWLDRAKLFQANSEQIREKEVELGLDRGEGKS